MNTESMTLEYRRLRTPVNDGQSLEIPALEDAGLLLELNQRILNEHSFEIASIPVAQFRRSARQELLELASTYTRRYRDVEFDPNSNSLILGGHQPSLFHPGVWFKNFCLANLAARHQSVGINLIIDNDLCTSKSLRLPTGSVDGPRIESLAFDSAGLMLPYEMQKVHDDVLFRSFGDRVTNSIAPIIDRPMIADYWKSVCDLRSEFENPFLAIAAARHRFEGTLGLNTLEVPLSTVCNTVSFWQFAAELLGRSAELHVVYNESVQQYRETHRIRSQSHPVPNLNASSDGWIESPFWVWNLQSTTRRRLMVRAQAGELELADNAGWQTCIPMDQIAEGLHFLAEKGICIRPRALVTTMYARLILSDLFLHGIGGAKYDQLTDAIISLFFKAQSPEFMVLTSTNKLPIRSMDIRPSDVSSIQSKLRDLIFHPEIAIDSQNPDVAKWIERKRELLANVPVSGSRRHWHQQLTEVNAALQPMVEPIRVELSRELREMKSGLERSKILGSREFAWPLFPESLVTVLSTNARI